VAVYPEFLVTTSSRVSFSAFSSISGRFRPPGTWLWVPPGQNILALWHTCTPLLALCHPGVVRFDLVAHAHNRYWPGVPQGQNSGRHRPVCRVSTVNKLLLLALRLFPGIAKPSMPRAVFARPSKPSTATSALRTRRPQLRSSNATSPHPARLRHGYPSRPPKGAERGKGTSWRRICLYATAATFRRSSTQYNHGVRQPVTSAAPPAAAGRPGSATRRHRRDLYQSRGS
jgi:hypothetical protein